MAAQKPIELIHARNLMSSLSTPAFLVDRDAHLVYYNDAAAAVLGRRFEEFNGREAEAWSREFGPFDGDGEPIPIEDLPMTRALRDSRPAHARFCLHSIDGKAHEVDLSALPIRGADGFSGAMAFFWAVGEPNGEIPHR